MSQYNQTLFLLNCCSSSCQFESNLHPSTNLQHGCGFISNKIKDLERDIKEFDATSNLRDLSTEELE